MCETIDVYMHIIKTRMPVCTRTFYFLYDDSQTFSSFHDKEKMKAVKLPPKVIKTLRRWTQTKTVATSTYKRMLIKAEYRKCKRSA